MPDKEVEEVELNVGDSVLNDEVDDDMIENDIYDHVDMENPFNIDSTLDDIDVELDEEED